MRVGHNSRVGVSAQEKSDESWQKIQLHGGLGGRGIGCHPPDCKCPARSAIEGAFAYVPIASTGNEERTFEILFAADECRSQECSGTTVSPGSSLRTAYAAIAKYGLANA